MARNLDTEHMKPLEAGHFVMTMLALAGGPAVRELVKTSEAKMKLKELEKQHKAVSREMAELRAQKMKLSEESRALQKEIGANPARARRLEISDRLHAIRQEYERASQKYQHLGDRKSRLVNQLAAARRRVHNAEHTLASLNRPDVKQKCSPATRAGLEQRARKILRRYK